VCLPLRDIITYFRLSWWFIGDVEFGPWVFAVPGYVPYHHSVVMRYITVCVIQSTEENYIQATQ
jgi:hypothetical protein